MVQSRIYLPEIWFPEGYNVKLEPEGEGWNFEPIDGGGKSGYIVIPTTDQKTERRLTIRRQ